AAGDAARARRQWGSRRAGTHAVGVEVDAAQVVGRRGPQPKPTALRILEGNPSHRPLPANEPQPRVGPPACPAWLYPQAKRHSQLIVKEWALAAPRLLTRVDGGVLAGYCQALPR